MESQGYKEKALEVSTDLDHRFELAIQLENLDVAHEIALKSDSETKFKHLGDLALSIGEVNIYIKIHIYIYIIWCFFINNNINFICIFFFF